MLSRAQLEDLFGKLGEQVPADDESFSIGPGYVIGMGLSEENRTLEVALPWAGIAITTDLNVVSAEDRDIWLARWPALLRCLQAGTAVTLEFLGIGLLLNVRPAPDIERSWN